MPSHETIKILIQLMEEGRYVEAIEQLYAPDTSMQENSLPPRWG